MDMPARADNARLAPQAHNALKHAAYSRAALLPDEDPAERRQLEEAYFDHFDPGSQPEVDAVRALVDLTWRRERINRAEAAMATHAVARAQDKLPAPLLGLVQEVHHLDVEVRLLTRTLELLRQAVASDRRPKETLQGVAPVLDRLLGWPGSVADLDPAQVVLDGDRALAARTAAVEFSRGTLRTLLAAAGPAFEAARAEASLLEPKMAARLLQERTTLSKAIERQMRLLRDLRGGTTFEGRILVAEGRIRDFHETRSAAPEAIETTGKAA